MLDSAAHIVALTADYNRLRFRPEAKKGHVESYFLRANDPERPRAVWLKATVFAPQKPGSAAVAELWCIVFDRDAKKRVWAAKKTLPWALCDFGTSTGTTTPRTTTPLVIRMADDAVFEFGANGGSARGTVRGDDDGACRWDLRLEPDGGPLAAPLSLMPTPRLIDAPFPKNKLLTPSPTLRCSGTLELAGTSIKLDRWLGMQGHNWGAAHAWEYAWGQCHFVDGAGRPFCMVEGFTGRIRVGPWTSPPISAMVVRYGEREYRFDALIDLWRQTARIDADQLLWELRMRGPHGEAALRATTTADDGACLGYHNPDGRLSYCINSKLARLHLRVNPVGEAGFECHSDHGAALEFLRNQPSRDFTRVV